MALRGIKVLEFGGLAPAPYCGMILSDFGASVTRVDRPNSLVDLDVLGRGKRSIAVDLKKESGVKVVRHLCKSADVLIEPFRRGVMEKLGLGPKPLMADNPGLIYARLTGFGQSGPFADMAGHDINYLALSGLLSALGRHGENPYFPANLLADFAGGGLMCATGILLALIGRGTTGRGQVIDANMVEGAAYVGSWIYCSRKLPGIWGNKRGKNILDGGSHFYNTYKTKDNKYMAVGALEPQFYSALLSGLGLAMDDVPHMTDFPSGQRRFAARFAEKTQEEWCRVFDGTDACVTPVLELEEAPLHRHNRERLAYLQAADGSRVPAPAPTLSDTPGRPHTTEPQSGEHTVDILTEMGFTYDELKQLEKEGAIQSVQNKSKL